MVIAAIYGSELKKSEARSGTADKAKAYNCCRHLEECFSTPDRPAKPEHNLRPIGDALVTYELEVVDESCR